MILKASVLLKSISTILILWQVCSADYQVKRFEYKYSFKGPHLVTSKGDIPFWTLAGDAIPSKEQLRLAPSIRSKRGIVWTKNAFSAKDWEIEVNFRVTGRGRVGADGLAVWFTSEKGEIGPVFGSRDKWNGLGVFFDSFDNDGQHNNPYVMAILNDGTKSYDHASDGSTQALGGCMRDFRNRPFPIKVVLRYEKNTLTLRINNGLSDSDEDLETCFTAVNVNIQPGYFGASAATGGLADDHDIISFLTWSLNSYSDEPKLPDDIKDSEKTKKQYSDFSDEFEKRRESYRKEHPDRYRDEDDEGVEGRIERDFRHLLEANKHLTQLVISLQRKFDGFSEIMKGSTGSNQQNDLQSMSQTQRELVSDVKTVRSAVDNLHSKVGGGGSQQVGELQNTMNELKTELTTIKTKLESGSGRTGGCPDVSCVGIFGLSFFMVLQMIVFFAYISYKQRQDAAAKKFF